MILGVVVNGGMVVHASRARSLAVCGGAKLSPVDSSDLPRCRSCERMLAKWGVGWPEPPPEGATFEDVSAGVDIHALTNDCLGGGCADCEAGSEPR